jgi:hypothetical protein
MFGGVDRIEAPRWFGARAIVHHEGVLARGLLTLSSIVFGATGVAYLAVPGLALDIVGIESSPTSDFLLRTEGLPLLFAAAIVWAFRHGGTRQQGVILVALAGYYILSAVIDLAAFAEGIVGAASLPSALVRIAIGAMCVLAAWTGRRLSRDATGPQGRTGGME